MKRLIAAGLKFCNHTKVSSLHSPPLLTRGRGGIGREALGMVRDFGRTEEAKRRYLEGKG